MATGSKLAAFFSKGTTLSLPRGATIGRSKAAVAAALIGIAFSATAHAQAPAAPDPSAPRVVSPGIVPPYAQGQVRAKPASATPSIAPVASAAVPPVGSPSSTPPLGVRPPAAVAGAAPPAGMPRQAVQGQRQQGFQNGNPQQQDRRGLRDDRQRFDQSAGTYYSVPYQPVLAPQGYLQDPEAYDDDMADGMVQAYPQQLPPAAYGQPRAQTPDGGFALGRPQPMPSAGRPIDPENAGRSIIFDGEKHKAQDVMATVAGARVAGVESAALMAIQSRSLGALQLIANENDDPNVGIDGPYAFTTESWLSTFSRFGSSLGLGSMSSAIVKDRDGTLTVNNPETYGKVMALRTDVYLSSILAGANLSSNDAKYRQWSGGTSPTLADLMVAHHAGPETMIRLSDANRRAPGTPLAALMKPNEARDLAVLVGLSDIRPPDGRAWTAGSFLGTLDNALKNGMTRYASSKGIQLPPDYKPLGARVARADFAPERTYSAPAGPR